MHGSTDLSTPLLNWHTPSAVHHNKYIDAQDNAQLSLGMSGYLLQSYSSYDDQLADYIIIYAPSSYKLY